MTSVTSQSPEPHSPEPHWAYLSGNCVHWSGSQRCSKWSSHRNRELVSIWYLAIQSRSAQKDRPTDCTTWRVLRQWIQRSLRVLDIRNQSSQSSMPASWIFPRTQWFNVSPMCSRVNSVFEATHNALLISCQGGNSISGRQEGRKAGKRERERQTKGHQCDKKQKNGQRNSSQNIRFPNIRFDSVYSLFLRRKTWTTAVVWPELRPKIYRCMLQPQKPRKSRPKLRDTAKFGMRDNEKQWKKT